MSLFTATSTSFAQAPTSTFPSYTITSSSTATATSPISLEIAQEEANLVSQKVAISTAQNDANVISQTLQISPTGVIGQFTYLNIGFAFKTSINGQAEFNGLIIPKKGDDNTKSLAAQITSKKIIYNINTLQPYLDTNHLSTISSHVDNYGAGYGNVIIRNVEYSSPTPKSIFSNNRISSIDFIINNLTYKIKIISNLKYFVNKPILEETTYNDLNNSVTGIEINDKTLNSISIISNNGEILTSFSNVHLSESYSADYLWNYIYIDFSKAFISGQSKNIYPVISPKY